MDVNQRIKNLIKENNLTEYKLAKKSNLSQSTISNIFKRNTVPSISTLESICNGLGITLSQFFAEGNIVELNREQKQLFDKWIYLTPEQKQALYNLIILM